MYILLFTIQCTLYNIMYNTMYIVQYNVQYIVQYIVQYNVHYPHYLQGWGRPSVLHAVIVIFLEFFAWGLLTVPVVNVMSRSFPSYTFLMNGMIQGVKVCHIATLIKQFFDFLSF